jgi:FtsZ-interacting cell division protein ZipA
VDSGQLVWIIIGVVVVLAIIAAAVYFNRKRKVDADRNRAAEMREKAKTDELGAREREAKAARAEADAKQAEVDAERLRRDARDKQQEAEGVRATSQEQLRKADELDPDVVTSGRGAEPGENVSERQDSPDEPRTDRRADTGAGTRSDDGDADGTPGERPRNL